jgi:quinoprotein glucose dehydrogenase
MLLAACSGGQGPVPAIPAGVNGGWPEPSGSKGGGQYSPLEQINRNNLGQLRILWTYASPDFAASQPPIVGKNMVVEATPILVNDTLVTCTSLHRVVALEASTGKPRWSFDPQVNKEVPSFKCRGVAGWSDSSPAVPQSSCAERIFSTSGDGRLFAVDARTGELCSGFGKAGVVDMREHLGPLKASEYYNSAPPLVVNDLVLANSAVRDGFRNDTAGGVLRAWDARSGALVWAWDPVGSELHAVTAEEARDGRTFTRGTPNVWTYMSADLENGLIFVSTGNAPPDHFKGKQRPIDAYGSSVVALQVATGAVAWSFTTVHHDLWDYDVAGQPVLYDAGGVPALAVATKQGHIFLLNRLTGKPLFPVEERPVPQTDVPGEWTSPTQPFPTHPLPIHGTALTGKDLNSMPYLAGGCKETLAGLRNEGVFTPPSLRGTLQNPGIAGGFGWGSGAINPQSHILIATYLNMPFIVQLVSRSREGDGNDDDRPFNWMELPQYGAPYEVRRRPFISAHGVPCVASPWGEIMAVDLVSGNQLWRKPLGNMRGRVPLIGSLINAGMPVAGGTLQTGAGLVFVAASSDETLRALDAATGDELWSTHLPFSAHATPMTFTLPRSGRQLLVISSGGALTLDQKAGDQLIAFALQNQSCEASSRVSTCVMP